MQVASKLHLTRGFCPRPSCDKNIFCENFMKLRFWNFREKNEKIIRESFRWNLGKKTFWLGPNPTSNEIPTFPESVYPLLCISSPLITIIYTHIFIYDLFPCRPVSPMLSRILIKLFLVAFNLVAIICHLAKHITQTKIRIRWRQKYMYKNKMKRVT